MNYNFIKNEFLKKHKIDNYEYLDKYINKLVEYKLDKDINKYTENHHILPVSTFPEYSSESWNIIKLNYEDHILSHLLLFKSINIRKYQRPLNWMMSYYKDRKEISNAAKNGWVNLKSNKEKYDKWKESRSKYMCTLSSYEQSRRAKLFWEKITDKEYLFFCKKMKDYWTEDRKIEKSKQMNEYYLNPENVYKKKIETKKRWDLMSIEDRDNFNLKMDIINKNEIKRKIAGDKIKELWKDEKYLSKMKERKCNSGTKVVIIKPNGEEIIIENMKKLTEEFDFSAHLIRKYRDKDIRIIENDLKDNKFLLDCKIKS